MLARCGTNSSFLWPLRLSSRLPSPLLFHKRSASSFAAQILRSTPSPSTLAKTTPTATTPTKTTTSDTPKKKTVTKSDSDETETKPKRTRKKKEEEVEEVIERKEDTPEGYMNTAKKVLKSTFGLDMFLPGQEDVLKTLFSTDNAAAIFPTGSGKSLCFQLPALVFPGLVVVVTPLISIMKDQVDYLKSIKVSAEALSGDLKTKKYQESLEKLKEGKYKIIFISPERFSNKEFLNIVTTQRISLIAIDEAHCISEWGLSFRPDYLRLAVLVKKLKAERTLVVTATASAKVVEDLKREFDIKQENVVRTGFYRSNLHLRAHLTQKDEKQETLLKCIMDSERPAGPTIVYVTYRKDAEDVADWLQNRPEMVGRGISCYHAGLDRSVRAEIQNWFLTSPDGIVVSTIAFGMGVNKKNIRYVYHYSLPGSLEDYAQGIGRAGRDGEKAVCDILADVGSDVKDLERLIVRETPSYKAIVGFLTDVFISGESLADRTFSVNTKTMFSKFFIKETKIATFLAQIEAKGYITQQPSSYYEKLVTMTDKFTKEKIPEIANYIHEVSLTVQLRELESVQDMLTFLSFNGCQYKHMGRYFGDALTRDCGHCNYCVTKKALSVRQLPTLSSKSAFDRYKESISVASSSSSSSSELPLDECHCNALGIKWTYNPQDFKGLTGWSFGIAKEYNGRLVYAHFPSLSHFKNLVQVYSANETVYEALLGITQRPFFAKLMVDPTRSNADEVQHAFSSFLIKVTRETLYLDLNPQDITMKKLGTVTAEAGAYYDEYLLRVDVEDAVFENAEDFKKFYKILHTRMCFPRNAEEKQWKKKLFLALKDKNNERLHPIYQLQACEPFYLGSTITKQLTQSPNFESELLGFYSNTKQWFNLDEVAPVGTAPLGMVFGV